jgi:cell division cycle protein 20 (cofactor of APC complex)
MMNSKRKMNMSGGDRFLPFNKNPELLAAKYYYSDDQDPRQIALQYAIFGESLSGNVLKYTMNKPPAITSKKTDLDPERKFVDPMTGLCKEMVHNVKIAAKQTIGTKPRRLPTQPIRALDAPDITEDFYVNVIDYSVKNVLSVALQQDVYVWNSETGKVSSLYSAQGSDNTVSCVSSMSNYLAIGERKSQVHIFDIRTSQEIRLLNNIHHGAVNTISWNRELIATAGADGTIALVDLRESDGKLVGLLQGHTGDVCGLKWSPDRRFLASGSADATVRVWDMSSRAEKWRFDHKSSVKALTWCPSRPSILATGGGQKDRSIRMFNVSSGTCLATCQTESQITGIGWSEDYDEIFTSHGISDGALRFFRYGGASLVECGKIQAHDRRIVGMALSPDGETIVTASEDESIKFWEAFPAEKKANKGDVSSARGNLDWRSNFTKLR